VPLCSPPSPPSFTLCESFVHTVCLAKCRNLSKVTFWGCAKFDNVSLQTLCKITSLVHLNITACFNITDAEDAEWCIPDLPNLRSLVAAECHRLGDKFVNVVATKCRNLTFFDIRYLRKVTDAGILALIDLPRLYCLDVSFVTKVTAEALGLVLEFGAGLAELRAFSCIQLGNENVERCLKGGTRGEEHLSVLDLRRTACVPPLLFLTESGELGELGEDSRASRPFGMHAPLFFTRDSRRVLN